MPASRECRSKHSLSVAALALVLAAAPAGAQEATRGQVVVDFAAVPPAPAWLASALEQSTLRELSGFSRIALLDKAPLHSERCVSRDATCLVALYRSAGADIAVLGTVSEATLTYEIYETWTGALSLRGSIDLGVANRSRASAQIITMLRPIVQTGGLVDTRPRSQAPPSDKTQAAQPSAGAAAKHLSAKSKALSRAKTPPSPAAPPATGESTAQQNTWLPRDPLGVPPANWVQIAFILMIVFLASPLLLVRSFVGPERLAQRERPASWLPTALAVIGLTLAVLAYATPEVHELAGDLAANAVVRKYIGVLMPLVGGVLWGGFALTTIRLVLPRLHGLEGVRHESLRPLLRTWWWVSFQRAGLLLGYAPFFAGAWFIARLSDLSAEMIWMFVIPATGLAVYVWLLSLVDNLSIYLDEHLVHLPATSRNPWHHTIRRYLAGYVRRAGLDLDAVLRRTLLLPGKGDGIVIYGGGLTKPRIVVSAEIRELALGELPEETAAPERAMDYSALPIGMLMPDDKALLGARGRRRAERADALRRDLSMRATPVRQAAPRVLGEAATTLGWVMPLPTEESVPLISNTSEDYHVVHELLTEHYARFERNLDDDEHDDTDPTQKDFLFGALLEAIGRVLRQDSLLATLRLTLALRVSGMPRVILWGIKAVTAIHARFASRHPATLADAYVALNSGRDHLIQYLDYLRTGAETHLTPRADPTLLFRTSREILNATSAQAPTGSERQLFRATPRNRLIWLSRFFPSVVSEAHERRYRALVTAGVVFAVAATVGVAVRAAMDYHPRYIERVLEMEKRIAEAQEGDDHGRSH